MLFKRNSPEQKDEDVCLHLLFLPFLCQSFSCPNPRSCFLFCAASCQGFARPARTPETCTPRLPSSAAPGLLTPIWYHPLPSLAVFRSPKVRRMLCKHDVCHADLRTELYSSCLVKGTCDQGTRKGRGHVLRAPACPSLGRILCSMEGQNHGSDSSRIII